MSRPQFGARSWFPPRRVRALKTVGLCVLAISLFALGAWGIAARFWPIWRDSPVWLSVIVTPAILAAAVLLARYAPRRASDRDSIEESRSPNVCRHCGYSLAGL